MTASELQKIMRPDAEISAEQLSAVEELVDALPWFSCGQLLLLKAMKQHHHPFFDTRLAFASLYAIDREQLCRYLQQVCSTLTFTPAADEMSPAPADEGFELLDFDEVCEAVVDVPLQKMEEKLQRREQNLQLIDKFLASEQPPKIVPRAGVSSEDMAAQAAAEPQGLVTETLADVYLSQGLLDKATRAYEQLSLVYPEKKAYFAARIIAVQRATVPS